MAGEASAQLAELRASFRPRLTARVEEIVAAWEAMRPAAGQELASLDPSDPGAIDLRRHLHRLAHSLAGTAGTFGFPQVGDAARTLERRLERVEVAPPPGGSNPMGDIETLVAALSRAAVLP